VEDVEIKLLGEINAEIFLSSVIFISESEDEIIEEQRESGF